MIQVTLCKDLLSPTRCAGLAKLIILLTIPPVGSAVVWNEDMGAETVQELVFFSNPPAVQVITSPTRFDEESDFDCERELLLKERWEER